MRDNITSEEQLVQYQEFNANFGNVYQQMNSVKEAMADESDNESEEIAGSGPIFMSAKPMMAKAAP